MLDDRARVSDSHVCVSVVSRCEQFSFEKICDEKSLSPMLWAHSVFREYLQRSNILIFSF